MAQPLKLIRQTLQQEGVIHRNRQRALPEDFFRIAVISPEGAAGLGDFQAGAAPLERFGVCRFHYFTALFQGPNAKDSLLRAIQEAAGLPDIQALVIIRGGGAVADLHWINELERRAVGFVSQSDRLSHPQSIVSSLLRTYWRVTYGSCSDRSVSRR